MVQEVTGEHQHAAMVAHANPCRFPRVQDWSAITGNPVKFALGLVSIVFDVIFVAQHAAFAGNGEAQEAVEGGEGDVDGLLAQEEGSVQPKS